MLKESGSIGKIGATGVDVTKELVTVTKETETSTCLPLQ